MNVRSINSLAHRMYVSMSKDEYKEALLYASSYENIKNHTLAFEAKDAESFSNGNIIGKLIILKECGYIIFRYSKAKDGSNHYQVDNMALTPTGIELLTSYSFVFFSLKSLKHILLSSVIAIIVVFLLSWLGLK